MVARCKAPNNLHAPSTVLGIATPRNHFLGTASRISAVDEAFGSFLVPGAFLDFLPFFFDFSAAFSNAWEPELRGVFGTGSCSCSWSCSCSSSSSDGCMRDKHSVARERTLANVAKGGWYFLDYNYHTTTPPTPPPSTPPPPPPPPLPPAPPHPPPPLPLPLLQPPITTFSTTCSKTNTWQMKRCRGKWYSKGKWCGKG